MEAASECLITPHAAKEAQALPGATVWRAARLVAGILAACVASLAVAAICSEKYPVLLSHALIAFALGLRHAVDCDHLAAIDNITRQLLLMGQRPVSVGFWFAMGHSTVVVVLTAVLASGYSWAASLSSDGNDVAGRVSLAAGLLSIGLLAGIGLLNASIAVDLFSEWSRLQGMSTRCQDIETTSAREDSLQTALSVIPLVRRLFSHVDRAYKMYGVGFLFGLSFDSATQVGLIGLAALTGSSGHVPPLAVMIFPIAFSCGMCLVDTVNGLLMVSTYSWTMVRPVQQLFYNFLVTSMSAGIALIICSLELLQIIAREVHLKGAFWDAVENVDMVSQNGYG